jgi:hypothetical protein
MYEIPIGIVSSVISYIYKKFLISTDEGSLFTIDEGLQFNEIKNFNQTINDIEYDNKVVYLALNDGVLLKSNNGDYWININTPTNKNINFIKAGGGIYLMGGNK